MSDRMTRMRVRDERQNMIGTVRKRGEWERKKESGEKEEEWG